MYCIKCGIELNNNEKFCPNCGQKIETGSDLAKFEITEIGDNFISGIKGLAQNKIPVIALFISLFLGMLFVGAPMFKISTIIRVESLGLFNYDGLRFLTFISIVFYIVAIIFILYPLLTKRELRTLHLLPAKIISIGVLLWFVYILLFALDGVKEYDGMATFSISASAWILVLSTIFTIVLSFFVTFNIKKSITENNKVDK